MKRFALIILLLNLYTGLTAQENEYALRYRYEINEGDAFLSKEDYQNAYAHYEKARLIARRHKLAINESVVKIKGIVPELKANFQKRKLKEIVPDSLYNVYYAAEKNYDYIVPFEGDFAKAFRRGTDYLVDTRGNEYRVAYSIADLHDGITALDLSSERLDSFPSKILSYTNLKVLILDASLRYGKYNRKGLPSQIEQLHNLVYLSAAACELKVVPETIGQLSNLEQLYLSDNDIKVLPESICDLSNLTNLALDENRHISLPETIGRLTNLKSLDLYKAGINILPESIGDLTQLRTLELSLVMR